MNNEIGIILQGTPYSIDQLSHLYSQYTHLGYNVVVSSYSQYVDSNIIKNFINNDDILEKYLIKDGERFTGNTNYQIITTQRGLKYFSSIPNIKYVLKLRADMEINHIEFYLNKWTNLIDSSIPPNFSPLDRKILTFGRSQYGEQNPWYISDYFNFGLLEDQNIYWDIPLIPIDKPQTRRAEEYLSSAFLQHNPKGTAKDYFIFDPTSAYDIFNYKWNSNLSISDACGDF
jgi:hypothetical protein